MDNLRQWTSTAKEYICHFLQVSARSTFGNDALANALRRGLCPALADQVALLPRTYDLHTLQKQILEAELALQERAQVRKERTPMPARDAWKRGKAPPTTFQHGGFSPLSPVSQSHPSSMQEAMEIDGTHLHQHREVERRRRRDQGLCFYCGSPNHQVYGCPERPERRINHQRSGR